MTASRPARRAQTGTWPAGLHSDVLDVLADASLETPFRFQADAVAALLDHEDVVVTAGTGAGKSAVFQVPALQIAAARRRGTVLYLAPTKALGRDQVRRFAELGSDLIRPAVVDGDTPADLRRQAAREANVVVTNPDMVSAALLPDHGRWQRLLAGLELVVIDESHVYRGVFGSHVAHVLRRLLRLAQHYGAAPQVLALSATIANPAEHVEVLSGRSTRHVAGIGAPDHGADITLWNPYETMPAPGTESTAPEVREGSALSDASRLLARLVTEGTRTIVFTRTRNAAELVARFTQERLERNGHDDLARAVAPYRGGYTPEERRRTERDLASGELLAVVATSALELGIDIGHLEASICVGFPGTVASLRQRWGRAGRTERGANFLLAGEDALDQYFMRHPRDLLERPVEAATIDPGNRHVSTPHLLAAASELPLTTDDDAIYGDELSDDIDALTTDGLLIAAPNGMVYTGADHPTRTLSLRSIGGTRISIVDSETGALIGEAEPHRARREVHAGAVYLHRGTEFLVDVLDLDAGVSLATPATPPFYTMPLATTDIEVVEEVESDVVAGTPLGFGVVIAHDEVTGFARKRRGTGSTLGTEPLVLPPSSIETEAVWFAPRPDVLEALGAERVLGSLHAAEHALIAMLPLIAMCDRWDIGGLSTDHHTHAGQPMIFVYDGHPGGVGIAHAGYAAFEDWVMRTMELVHSCPCTDGCPSCVQSPKCGNLNEPLDKAGAVEVLASLLEPAST